ncbi:MAG TPA: hypothetical protein VMT17_02725 [Anaeromyxobacteraceae bacterium]|nr:hypothetical protein [Anaeromyxobacteraceae bacterium]
MRISRGRLFLRAGLLLVGGTFMLVRGCEARRTATDLAGPGRLLAERVGMVEALVGALALATAAAAIFSLRPRKRRHSLHLGGPRPPGGPMPPPPPSGGP